MKNTPRYIIVHHTGTIADYPDTLPEKYTFEMVRTYHTKKGWETIGYHYFIDAQGIVHQGREDLYHGAHCREMNMNTQSIGICLAGDFDTTLPNTAQIHSLKKLLREKNTFYQIPKDKIVPHRHFTKKSCYGKNISDTWARELLD